MAKQYQIRNGEVFDMGDGCRKHGGDIIELDDDVAALHATRVELVATKDQPAVPVDNAE